MNLKKYFASVPRLDAAELSDLVDKFSKHKYRLINICSLPENGIRSYINGAQVVGHSSGGLLVVVMERV